MSAKTYLYIYENKAQREIYVGVGKSMGRVWEQHNAEAEQLRERDGTEILQSIEPFSSWEDARKAEAIAIHVAMISGLRVVSLDESLVVAGDQVRLTNRSGTESSAVLRPAVLRRSGQVQVGDLKNTAIVTIAASEMDGRRGPYGALPGAVFSERARKWWRVAREKQERITRLIAILKGSRGVILGDWDVDPRQGYREDGGGDGDVFPLLDPSNDDPRGVKGKRLVGVRGQPGPVYSPDLSD